jgi:hypothetical protein
MPPTEGVDAVFGTVFGGDHGGRGNHRTDDEYFPGRPGDAPEPGTGDAPAAIVPEGVHGVSRGKAAGMESARDQLIATTHLTIQAAGQAQEQCAAITVAIEELDGRVLADLIEKIEAAQVMASAAVGASGAGSLPESAERMTANLAAARSTAEDVQAALQLATVRIAAVHGSLAAAVDNATTYRGPI